MIINEPNDLKYKLFSLGFTLLFFLILLSRLFYLQIIKADYYHKLSDQNRIRIVKKRAARGMIRDRNGNVMVGNEPSYSISALPFEFSPTPEILSKLSALTGYDENQLIENYENPIRQESRYTPIRLASDITLEDMSYIKEHSADFPGITIDIDPVRQYPKGSIAPHLLGYTGQVSIEELREGNEYGIKSGDIVGKSGVEDKFDYFLRGEDGIHYIEVRVNGEVVGDADEFEDIKPISGADIFLTLDVNLQMVAESLMTGIEKGCFIAMDPRNGDILAMVSKPDFDLSIFSRQITDSIWSALNDYDKTPLINRNIQGTYPPASGLKLASACIGIDKGYVNPYTKLEPCKGKIYYGDRIFNCWDKKGHGNINLIQAISKSCDVYFYQLGLMIGLDDWSYYTKLSGFGNRTEIDLPSEATGFVPDRSYYNKRYGRMGWGYGVVLNLTIGQGETLVTPLQLLSFFAAVANGGALYRPRIVEKITPPYGRPTILKASSRGRLPFTQDALKTCVDGCIEAVNDPWGTAPGAYMEDVLVAGKTGTAQNPHGVSHAWFTSFAPANEPRIAVLILVEHGGSGGYYAPIHKMFYDYYFHYWERGFERL